MKLEDLSDPRYRNSLEEDDRITPPLSVATRLSLFFITMGWAWLLISFSIFDAADYIYGLIYVLYLLTPIFVVLFLLAVGAYLWLCISMWMSRSDERLHVYGIANLMAVLLLVFLTVMELELGFLQDYFIALSPTLITCTFMAIPFRLGALRVATPAWWSLWEQWLWLYMGISALELLLLYSEAINNPSVFEIFIPLLSVLSLGLVLINYKTYTLKEKRVALLSWLTFCATLMPTTHWLWDTFASQVVAAVGLFLLGILLYVLLRTQDYVPLQENFEDGFENNTFQS